MAEPLNSIIWTLPKGTI